MEFRRSTDVDLLPETRGGGNGVSGGDERRRRSQVGKPHNSKLGRRRSSVTLLIHIWKVGRRWEEEERRWKEEGSVRRGCRWVEDGGGWVSGRADWVGGKGEREG